MPVEHSNKKFPQKEDFFDENKKIWLNRYIKQKTMPEETTPKLNLSALLKKETENESLEWRNPELPIEVLPSQEKIENEETDINILNPNVFPEKKVAINIPESKKEENNIMITAGSDINPDESLQWEIIWWKINFLALQKTRNEQWEKDKQNKIVQKDNDIPKAEKEEKVELFWNYKPSFEWRAKKFFNQLREFRLKARTHIRALMALCVITWWIVGWAFYFFPEKHSLAIYKANILWVWDKKSVETTDIIPEDIIPEDIISNPTDDKIIGTSLTNTWENLWSNSWVTSEAVIENTQPTIIEIPKTEEGKNILRKEAIKKYFLK